MLKLLAVFGATGQQGGALIDYIMKNSELSGIFKIRGITRNKSKPAALVLMGKGIEIVEADMDDVDSLIPAVAGSYAVFAMTNFWGKASASVEIAQGKAIADAAVACGATLLIWSSLPNVTEMTSGKITGAKHFDSKAEVEVYIRGLPIRSVFFMPGWFMQNHLAIMKPKLAADGSYRFAQPWKHDSRIPLIDIDDTGKFPAPALLHPENYNGTNFTAATAFYTAQEMVDGWTKVTGKEVRFVALGDRSADSTLPDAQKLQLKESLGLTDYGYFGPTGAKDLEWTLAQMTDVPTTWEEFVKKHEPWF